MFGLEGPIETTMERRAGHAAALAWRAAASAPPSDMHGCRSEAGRRALAIALLATVFAGALPLEAGPLEGSPPERQAPRALASPRGGLEALPAAAEGVISNVLGAADSAYDVHALPGGGLGAHSAGMSETFRAGGVSLAAGSARLSLDLRSLEGAGRRETLARAPARARENEVSYSYRGLRAWYRNGPAGLEQGFTLARAPFVGRRRGGSAASRVMLAFAVSGNTAYRLDPGGRGVTFTRGRSAALHLGALAASDAAGRALPSGVDVGRGELRLWVDAAGARYPITIDPLLAQGTKLTGSAESAEGEFGLSVAISEDGTTALVGAPRDNNFAGSVWVFVRTGTTWAQQGPRLVAGASAGSGGCVEEAAEVPAEEGACGFGASVALSGDGNTAIVGSPRDALLAGGAWVFTRTGTTWTRESTELMGAGEVGEGHFGKAVALSFDGTIAAVSGPNDNHGKGAVWFFKRASAGWSLMGEAKITPSDGVGASYFGHGVALSPDGMTAVVGGPGDSGYRGAAWTFTRSGATWAQQAKVTGGEEEQGLGRFGWVVALSEFGATVLVGGPRDAANVGAAWLFKRSGPTLTQDGPKLTGEGEAGEGLFGRTVAISADGRTAIIGAPRDNSALGAAWVYTYSLGEWTSEKFAADTSRGQFGASIALSPDANVPLFGEPLENRKLGVAWAGLPPGLVASISPTSGPAAGGTEVTITGAGFDGASAVHFGAAAASYVVVSATTIIALAPPGPGSTTVDVTVDTPHGTSQTSPLDRFTYVGPREAGPPSSEPPVAGGPPQGTEPISGLGGTVGAGALGFQAAAPSARCGVALLSRRVSVLRHHLAAPRLRRTGAGRCRGKLTLTVRVRGKHGHVLARAIGSTRFVLSSTAAITLRVGLNALGRSLLRVGHGRLRASLVVVRTSPLPVKAQSATIRLRTAR